MDYLSYSLGIFSIASMIPGVCEIPSADIVTILLLANLTAIGWSNDQRSFCFKCIKPYTYTLNEVHLLFVYYKEEEIFLFLHGF